ncbi:MAG: YcxB family protein [Bacteroidetes bacterium]|nr:YcxB family protein [Bacteroidota bacterium]
MIEANDIRLEKKTYFKLLLRNRFSKAWWIYLLPFAGAVLLQAIDTEFDWGVRFMLVYGVVNPLWVVAYLYMHTSSPTARAVALPRSYRFGPQEITVLHGDGSSDQYSYAEVHHFAMRKGEMMIYFSASQFIYLPKGSITPGEMNHIAQQISLSKNK